MIIEKPLNVLQLSMLCVLQSERLFDHKCTVVPIKDGIQFKLKYADYVVKQGLLPRLREGLPFCDIQYVDKVLTITKVEEKKNAAKKSKGSVQDGK